MKWMDREKLIKDIEEQMSEPTNEYVVLWFSEAEYVLELLKEQEAVEPISDDDGGYWCSSCHEDIVWHQPFCSNCGKPILWEGR